MSADQYNLLKVAWIFPLTVGVLSHLFPSVDAHAKGVVLRILLRIPIVTAWFLYISIFELLSRRADRMERRERTK